MRTRGVVLNAAVGEALIGVQTVVADSLRASGDKVKIREGFAVFCAEQSSTQTISQLRAVAIGRATTDDDIAPSPPVSAARESSASLAEETDVGRLSQRPDDNTVARADLQRDEIVRRWGWSRRVRRASAALTRPNTASARAHADSAGNAIWNGRLQQTGSSPRKLRLTHALCSNLGTRGSI